MPEDPPSRAGAFGRWWRIYGEMLDSRVVRQTTSVSCHSACGEMLSDGRITQAQLLEVLGEGMKTFDQLLRALNGFGRGIFAGEEFQPSGFDRVLEHSPWIAMVFAADARAFHMVLVESFDTPYFTILDPWDGTKYTVLKGEFFDFWTGLALWQEAL